MGTVTNGKKWAGACVNGKVVSGLVKNGVVFYRKPVSTYKRRIMVGDVLGGKTIYNDFKNDDSFFQEWLTSKDYSSFITSDQSTSNYDYFEFYIGSDESTYLSLAVNYPEKGEEISIYNYDNGNVTIVPKVTIRNDLNYDTVTSIVDNVAYRHLFIEDENIRPLEVGDVITENTKFYFTFPDDFYNYIKSTVDTSGRGDEVIIVELDNDNELDHLSLWYDALIDSSKAYCVRMSGNYYSTMEDVYRYIERTSPLLINKSIMTGTEIENFVGTVTMVDKTNEAYQHILVDTTTLGA